MIQSLRTENKILLPDSQAGPGAWIKITAPSANEAADVAAKYDLDPDDIMAAMDPEEKTRIEFQDENTCMIIFDIPTLDPRSSSSSYTTIPLAVFMTSDHIITVCSEETSILQSFENRKQKDFSTKKKLRFTYQILMETALLYQRCLKNIDKQRRELEANIGSNTSEADLIGLHEFESSLVYFATSLHANSNILTRLRRYKRFELYEEDEDLLDDTVVETQQAIEMTQIYQNIMDGTENLMSTIINNRLNNIMKILTSITVILAIPTIITGAFGMNLNSQGMPFSSAPNGFAIICIFMVVICLLLIFILHKAKLF